jgi:hypothetical protein
MEIKRRDNFHSILWKKQMNEKTCRNREKNKGMLKEQRGKKER